MTLESLTKVIKFAKSLHEPIEHDVLHYVGVGLAHKN
jgi:hypothetical protein